MANINETDLGKWMITDGGDYDSSVTYEQLTMVTFNHSTYLTLKDVTGVEPSDDGVNYRLLIQGYSTSELLNNATLEDKQGLAGEANAQVVAQTLVDAIANKVANELVSNTTFTSTLADYVTKSMISNVQVNDENKIPTSAVAYALDQEMDRMNRVALVTLTAAGWTGDAAPYEQTVTVEGATEDIDVVLVRALTDGATEDEQKAYGKAYGIVSGGTGTVGNGNVTFKVYKKPETDITVGLRGI